MITPAQAERLAMLAEECAEVVQAVTKILRHGYESYHPDDPKRVSNREALGREVVDVLAVAEMLSGNRDIVITVGDVEMSKARKLRWMHHAGGEV